MTGYGVGASHASSPPKVVLVDMPGYGYKALSKWAEEMMKYLKARKQFRRAFLLVDADVGPKATDRAMLDFCRHYAVPHQVVLARADKALSSSSNKIRTGVVPKNLSLLDHKMRNLKPVVQPPRAVDGSGTPGDAPGALGEILATSAKNELGLDNLRWAILTAAGYGGSVEVKSDAASAAPSSLSSGKTVSADL